MPTTLELEQRIHDLEQQYLMLRTVVDNLPVAIYAKDCDSRFIFANKAIAETGGYQSPDELIGKSDHDFHPTDLADEYLKQEQQMLEENKPIVSKEEQVIHSDKSEHWYLTSKIPVSNDGEVIGFVGIGQDITDRKNRERIEQERDILRQMIDYLPDSMFIKDAEGRYVTGNTRQLYLSQKETIEELIGNRDIDLYPELGEGYYQAEMELIESGDAIINREEIVIDPDTGKEMNFLVTKIPIKDDNGIPIGIVGIGRDVTEWVELQEAEKRQRELIEKQRQALLDLSAPIIPITDDVIVMPLIGSIDGERAQIIMRSLLAGISQFSASTIILDLTGVPMVDSEVAGYLHRSIQAIKLKGARAIITGITEEIAETIVDLGIDWSKIETWRDMQSALPSVIQIY